MQQKPIFRQVALERLSSPEQLDQLMPLIALRGWVALLTLIGLVVLALAWSAFDTIPTQVTGRGILIRGWNSCMCPMHRKFYWHRARRFARV